MHRTPCVYDAHQVWMPECALLHHWHKLQHRARLVGLPSSVCTNLTGTIQRRNHPTVTVQIKLVQRATTHRDRPYAERPSRRTSAGEAALSGSNTCPHPRHPSHQLRAYLLATQHTQEAAVAAGAHAGGEGSPGVMSRWAGSSTKTTQPQSFAFAPHVPGDTSPDVQPFKTSPEVSKQD